MFAECMTGPLEGAYSSQTIHSWNWGASVQFHPLHGLHWRFNRYLLTNWQTWKEVMGDVVQMGSQPISSATGIPSSSVSTCILVSSGMPSKVCLQNLFAVFCFLSIANCLLSLLLFLFIRLVALAVFLLCSFATTPVLEASLSASGLLILEALGQFHRLLCSIGL